AEKTYVNYNDVIQLPDNISLHIAYTSQHLERFTGVKSESLRRNTIKSPNISYPCLLSINENINPRLIQLIDPTEFKVGRDPICHIWVNSPHISREHAHIRWLDDKVLSVTDLSSNGTFIFDKQLPKGEEVFLNNQFIIIDFGNEFRVAYCHNEQERLAFIENQIEAYVQSIDPDYLNRKLFKTYSEVTQEQQRFSLNNFSIPEEKFEEKFITDASDLLVKEDTQEFESFVDREDEDVETEGSLFAEELTAEEIPPESTYQMTSVFQVVKEESFSHKENTEVEDSVVVEENENRIIDESDKLNQEVIEEGGHKIQKWILIFLIMLLLGFCLLLVVGFLSDNYFY
ncbi:MAG: FHA domain-containing protein, partial [Proteobacteria bacterium]|nr:FHA domain-containing protein [Pseudomonadota bacterium]